MKTFLLIASIAALSACGDLPQVLPRKDRQADAAADMLAGRDDMGAQDVDLAQPVPDMRQPAPDMRQPEPDMQLPDLQTPDMRQPEPDMAQPEPDMQPPQPKTVGVFLLQGHGGRTTLSCDGGQAWVAERSDDPTGVCFVNGYDCDHAEHSGKGLAAGQGWLMATFGWGKPGSIRRSRDGVTWERVHEGSTFGGLAFGQGVFVAGSKRPLRSMDEGLTWQGVGVMPTALHNVRSMGYADVGSGRFVLVFGDSGATDIVTSADLGLTWTKATTVPAGCGASPRGQVLGGNGVILVLGGDGAACRSTNLGQDWSIVQVGGQVDSHLVWTGSEFMAWGRGKRYSSPDGQTWTARDISPSNLNLGPVAAGQGAFAAVRGGWQQWYEKQEFYQSSDGLTWRVLDKAKFTGSHPGQEMIFAPIAANALCPAP